MHKQAELLLTGVCTVVYGMCLFICFVYLFHLLTCIFLDICYYGPIFGGSYIFA